MNTPQFLCFGHRGACGYEPENTLRSVRKALELGVDGIEVDVHLADGRLVVIHDDTLDRTTNGFGPVSGKSIDHLRSLDAGRGERIPLLEEIFDAANRQAIINVELKGPNTAALVAQLIGRYIKIKGWKMTDFLVSSFDLAQLQTIKKLLPEIRLGILANRVAPDLVAFAERLGAWSLHVSKRGVTPELVADAHQHGLKVFAFTINKPAEITKMAALAIDGVFTDFPDRVAKFVAGQNQLFRKK